MHVGTHRLIMRWQESRLFAKRVAAPKATKEPRCVLVAASTLSLLGCVRGERLPNDRSRPRNLHLGQLERGDWLHSQERYSTIDVMSELGIVWKRVPPLECT